MSGDAARETSDISKLVAILPTIIDERPAS